MTTHKQKTAKDNEDVKWARGILATIDMIGHASALSQKAKAILILKKLRPEALRDYECTA